MSSPNPQFPTVAFQGNKELAKLNNSKQAAIMRRFNLKKAIDAGKLTNLPDDRVSFEGI